MSKLIVIRMIVGVLLSTLGLAQLPALDGEVSPANRWYMQDGCASRSNRSLTPVALRDLRSAWKHSFEGTIEGDPLVWDDLVVVCELTTKGRRVAHVLSLRDGAQLSQTEAFKVEEPLQPNIWDRTLVLRSGPKKLQSYFIGSKRLYKRWNHTSRSAIRSWLRFGSEVYVVDSRGISRVDMDSKKVRWTFPGTFRTPPSLFGNEIYIAGDSEIQNAVFRIDRELGRLRDYTEFGYFDAGVPKYESEARLRVSKEVVFLSHVSVVQVGKESAANGFVFRRTEHDSGTRLALVLTTLVNSACALEPKKFFAIMGPDQDRSWVRSDGELSELLASEERRPQLFDSVSSPTMSQGICFVGDLAFDTQSVKILWTHAGTSAGRVIPARDSLLVQSDEHTLEALRHGAGVQAWSASKESEQEIAAARLILSDGSIHEGSIQIKGEEGTVTCRADDAGEEPQSWPLADALLVESSASNAPLYWASPVDAIRAVKLLVNSALQMTYLQLAERAVEGLDGVLLARMIDQAWQAGANEKSLKSLRRKLTGILKRKRPVVKEIVDQILFSEKQAKQSGAQALWQRIESLPEGVELHDRAQFLRELIKLNPNHAGARDMVRALLPPEMEPEEPLQSAAWLDFALATHETKVRIVRPPNIIKGQLQRRPSADERLVLTHARGWRKDLVGIRSDRLLVITPPSSPLRIANCLSVGELVCDALEELFEGHKPAQWERHPLTLLLYSSKEEYLSFSRFDAEWTAGHYSPSEQISRMYLPDGQTEFDRVLETYVHELTHHWIDLRCPLFPPSARSEDSAALPGYWIVEGMASLIEEFLFDRSTRTWSSRNPRADSLDVVANAEKLLSWKFVFRMSIAQRSLVSKEAKGDMRAPVSWTLGRVRSFSKMSAFYSQSTAACQYLFHANDGKRRADLLRFITAYYTGDRSNLNFEQFFGISEDDMGKEIEAWAKKFQGP